MQSFELKSSHCFSFYLLLIHMIAVMSVWQVQLLSLRYVLLVLLVLSFGYQYGKRLPVKRLWRAEGESWFIQYRHHSFITQVSLKRKTKAFFLCLLQVKVEGRRSSLVIPIFFDSVPEKDYRRLRRTLLE